MGFFKDSIIINSGRMLDKIDKRMEHIANDLFTTVVKFSPNTLNGASTAKGEFINNWNAASNREKRTHTSVRSMSGDASLASIRSLQGKRTFRGRDGYVTLTNTTHYGVNVEYDGWMVPPWSGTIGPYAPVRNAFIVVAPRYK